MSARPIANESWRSEAACIGKPTAMFFPEEGDPGHAAKLVCAGCPVRQPCLAYGLKLPNDSGGIYGGLTEPQRIRLKKGDGNRSRKAEPKVCANTKCARWFFPLRDRQTTCSRSCARAAQWQRGFAYTGRTN